MRLMQQMIASVAAAFIATSSATCRDGRRSGFAEGRALGVQKGFEVGHEVGYYAGCCHLWRQLQTRQPQLLRCVLMPLHASSAASLAAACLPCLAHRWKLHAQLGPCSWLALLFLPIH